jgi:hypothetical protein
MTRPESQRENPARSPKALNAKLNKRLASYVAAASAAGVGVLAWAQPADAEIVYTPANTPILINTPLALDLNNDGTIDFELSNNYLAGLAKTCTICSFFEHASLKVTPAQTGNAIWVMSSNSIHTGDLLQRRMKHSQEVAAPVFWGVVAGGPRKFQSSGLVMDSDNAMQTFGGGSSNNSVGQWGKNRPIAGSYLGLKFTIGGQVHYGWARIVVHADRLTITATLAGYAYETIPNQAIITGFTQGTVNASAEMNPAPTDKTSAADIATLGRLAQGATGLSAWRVSQPAAQNTAPVSGK